MTLSRLPWSVLDLCTDDLYCEIGNYTANACISDLTSALMKLVTWFLSHSCVVFALLKGPWYTPDHCLVERLNHVHQNVPLIVAFVFTPFSQKCVERHHRTLPSKPLLRQEDNLAQSVALVHWLFERNVRAPNHSTYSSPFSQ